jgi:cytochrome c
MKSAPTLLAATLLLALAGPVEAQDRERGKSQFGQCRACHTLDKGQNRVGPTLFGVFGRAAGTVEKFAYSEDMKLAGQKGLKWDEASMFDYLADPGEFLKKYLGKAEVSNKMPNKFPNEDLRKNVIAYIKHELAAKSK